MNASPTPDRPRDPFRAIGTVVAKHRITRLIGEGGMGAVYEGEHIEFGERRALKFCRVGGATMKRRAVNEARAGAMLKHPAICVVHDLAWTGEENETAVIVMELLEGQTLLAAIAEAGLLPWQAVFRVMADVCDALAVAHSSGVIHRDIKPDNIFLTPTGTKVVDFGVAKLIEAAHTVTGSAIGTPRFMSPEQARDAKRVDGRTDIYGCGVVMYEAISGKVIFDGKNDNDLLLAILEDEPRPFRVVAPWVPNHVAIVVQRCIAKERAKRFATALELKAALEQSLKSGDGPLRARASAITALPPSEAPTAADRPVPTVIKRRPRRDLSTPLHVPRNSRALPIALMAGALLAAAVLIRISTTPAKPASPPSSPPVAAPAPAAALPPVVVATQPAALPVALPTPETSPPIDHQVSKTPRVPESQRKTKVARSSRPAALHARQSDEPVTPPVASAAATDAQRPAEPLPPKDGIFDRFNDGTSK